MLIKSLEDMEAIVQKNKDLSWDGWSVVHKAYSPKGWSDPSAVYVGGRWYIEKRFDLSSAGWEIPNTLVR
jgi:hypothetical protein